MPCPQATLGSHRAQQRAAPHKAQHERKAGVIAKVVGDLTGWEKDAAKYEASFRKLMQALQPETDAGEAPGAGAGD